MIKVTNTTTGKSIKVHAVMSMKTKTRTIQKRKTWWKPHTWITRYYTKRYKVKAGYTIHTPPNFAHTGDNLVAEYEVNF